MGLSGKIKIEGMDSLERKLKKLPEKIQKNIMRAAIQAGASTLAKRIKAAAPVDTGALRKSIKAKRKRGKPTEVQSDVVTTAPHAHLIEFGHALKKGTGDKQTTIGQVPANPFFRNTLDQSRGDIVREITKKIVDRLASEASKE